MNGQDGQIHEVGRPRGSTGDGLCGAAFAASFQGLGYLPGGEQSSSSGAVSADGSVVVGWSGYKAFRWTATGGMQGLGDLSGGDFQSQAPAANMCEAAVGTETDGSVVCPSGNNLLVGIKPTIGLIPGEGIIPIAHSQDTAGPMARTVTDAAILLAVMADLPAGYTASLKPGLLRGARIGVDRKFFTLDYQYIPANNPAPVLISEAERALKVMEKLGATLVDTDTGDVMKYADDELNVLLYEIKADMARYLGGLSKTSMRTLADLIKFNKDHCKEEMKFFGQEWFEKAEATSGLNDQVYKDARAKCIRLSHDEGIDAAIARDRLDAIVAPIDSWASQPAAVAGYPNINVPIGLADGRPTGLWMYGGRLQKQKLIGYAYNLEQALRPRSVPPQYLNAVPAEPPDAGLCATPAAAKVVAQQALGNAGYHLNMGRLGCHCL